MRYPITPVTREIKITWSHGDGRHALNLIVTTLMVATAGYMGISNSAPLLTANQEMMNKFALGTHQFAEGLYENIDSAVKNNLALVKMRLAESQTDKTSTSILAQTSQSITPASSIDISSIRSNLISELESYIDARLAQVEPSTSPVTQIIQNIQPTIYQSITRQSDADSTRRSTIINNVTQSGTLTNPTITGATISGTTATFTTGTFTNLCIGGDCKTSWPSPFSFSTLATGEVATSTTLVFTNGLISTASSTLTTFSFTNATGTSATTTNFFSTTASSTNLFSSLLTVGGTGLVVDSSRNVGIGTAGPATKLEVRDDTIANPTIRITSQLGSTNTSPALRFSGITSSGQGNNAYIRLLSGTDAGGSAVQNDSGLQFEVQDNGTTNLALTINQSGNVGIASTTPAYKLTVNGSGIAGDGTLANFSGQSNERIEFQHDDGATDGMRARWYDSNNLNTVSISGHTTPYIAFGAVSGIIRTSTTDGSDNKNLSLSAGGATDPSGWSNSRGGSIYLYGNEDSTATAQGYVTVAIGDAANAAFSVWGNSAHRLRITKEGTITFNSGITAAATGNYLCINTSSYEVTRGNGSACSTSSARFKENVENINYGLDEVLSLRPVSFTYKEETNIGPGTKLGFIAEEMDLIIPEVVNHDDEGLASGIDYPVLTSILTRAIQEIAQISGAFKTALVAWLADAANGITKLFAKEVYTEKLCVKKSDGTDICLTGDEIATVFSGASSSSSSSSDNDPAAAEAMAGEASSNEETATSTDEVIEETPAEEEEALPELAPVSSGVEEVEQPVEESSSETTP